MALGSLPPHLYPHGSAAFAAVQQLGGATGIAILISAYTLGSDSGGTSLLTVAQTVSGSEAAFAVAGLIATVSLICSVFVRRARAEGARTPPDCPPDEPGIRRRAARGATPLGDLVPDVCETGAR
jgi:DHA2 family lincomycin resistance protein-like MFS transporter